MRRFLALLLALTVGTGVAGPPSAVYAADATSAPAATAGVGRVDRTWACAFGEAGTIPQTESWWEKAKRLSKLKQCAADNGITTGMVLLCAANSEPPVKTDDTLTNVFLRYGKFKVCLNETVATVSGAAAESALYIYVVNVVRAQARDLLKDAELAPVTVTAEAGLNSMKLDALAGRIKEHYGEGLGKLGALRDRSRRLIEFSADLVKVSGEVAGLLPDMKKALDDMSAGVAQTNAALTAMLPALDQVNAALAETNAGIAKANNGMDQLNAGVNEANAGLAQMNTGLAEALKGMDAVNKGVDGINSAARCMLCGLDTSHMFDGLAVGGQPTTLEDIFNDRFAKAISSLLLDLTPFLGDAKGIQEAITGTNNATGESLGGWERALGGVFVLHYLKGGGKAIKTAAEAAKMEKTLAALKRLQVVMNALKATGRIPAEWASRVLATLPAGLPGNGARIWRETDAGDGVRLAYSDDGLAYVTFDDWKTSDWAGSFTPGSKATKSAADALRTFASRRYQFGNATFLLDKGDMEHILVRHHPDYLATPPKEAQTYFDRRISVDDIQRIVGDVLSQNREKVTRIGTGWEQVEGVVDGVTYTVGIGGGHIGQLYPK